MHTYCLYHRAASLPRPISKSEGRCDRKGMLSHFFDLFTSKSIKPRASSRYRNISEDIHLFQTSMVALACQSGLEAPSGSTSVCCTIASRRNAMCLVAIALLGRLSYRIANAVLLRMGVLDSIHHSLRDSLIASRPRLT